MRQVVQQARTGEVSVIEVPAPQLLPGCALVRIAASLVSAGTERASSEFARKNLLQKAQARPDLVRQVIEKVRRDGLLAAVQSVRTRLDQPSSPGYSSSGTLIAVGEGISDLAVGDRVACAGAGYAIHGEIASVPRLLLAKFPEGSAIGFDEAAFTTLGAVALHGVRTAEVKIGDVVGVIGLGLVGQLAVQILKAAGCRVLGLDLLPERADLGLRLGADGTSTSAQDFRDLCAQASGGSGVDAVLITAETSSSAPVNLAGEIARDRGTVVAVGTVGMEMQRKPYYEKELAFRVSRSYGPGRYDAAYEQKGRDYPIGYVRWSETRNMTAFLDLVTGGKVAVTPLITHRFPIERASAAYDLITGRKPEAFLGVLIEYPEHVKFAQKLQLPLRTSVPAAVTIGLLGAGNFALTTLLPAMQKAGDLRLIGVCNANGSRSRYAAEKFRFQYCTTDEAEIVNDPAVNTVVISTRHHLHAKQAVAALTAGKHVFCEKPLCLHEAELADIVQLYSSRPTKPLLMVGFNRRFAPMAQRMKSFLARIHEPMALHYRVNAGYVERDHWVHDPEQGGGRIVGEVCHFVDFLTFLTGSSPVEVHARAVSDSGQYSGDNAIISIRFADGSQGTITYLANGDRAFSKERVEVFGGGSVAVLDDFRRLELVRHGRKKVVRSRWQQDKGHAGEWVAFSNAIQNGGPSPISFDQIVSASLATLRIRDSLALGQPLSTDVAEFVSSVLSPAETSE